MCSIKLVFLKTSQNSQEKPASESPFNKVAGRQRDYDKAHFFQRIPSMAAFLSCLHSVVQLAREHGGFHYTFLAIEKQCPQTGKNPLPVFIYRLCF